jgi:hypothetical protein
MLGLAKGAWQNNQTKILRLGKTFSGIGLHGHTLVNRVRVPEFAHSLSRKWLTVTNNFTMLQNGGSYFCKSINFITFFQKKNDILIYTFSAVLFKGSLIILL